MTKCDGLNISLLILSTWVATASIVQSIYLQYFCKCSKTRNDLVFLPIVLCIISMTLSYMVTRPVRILHQIYYIWRCWFFSVIVFVVLTGTTGYIVLLCKRTADSSETRIRSILYLSLILSATAILKTKKNLKIV